MNSNQYQKIVVKLQQNPDPRVHHLLFSRNSPFKPKVVKNKMHYQRHAKHPGRDIFLD